MAGLPSVTVDLERAEVVLAGRRITLTADASGPAAFGVTAPARFRVVDDGDGTTATVRLLTFGERSRLVRLALADAAPARALLDSLRNAALDGPERQLFDAVLLALTGGAEQAPDFEGCAVDAARARAWNWQRLHDTAAILVDRAAPRAEVVDPAGGWKRFVFPGADPREMQDLLDSMIATLLARGSGVERLPETEIVADLEPAPPPRRFAARSTQPVANRVGDSSPALPSDDGSLPRAMRWRALRAAHVPAAATAGVESQSVVPAHAAERSTTVPAPERKPAPREPRAGDSLRRSATSASSANVAVARPHVALSRTSPLPQPAMDAPPSSSPVQPVAAPHSTAFPAGASDALMPAAPWQSAPEATVARAEWASNARQARRGQAWPAPMRAVDAAATSSPRMATTVDVIDQVASALAAECDLRGLDT